MINIAILGSTGSIGTQTLEVVAAQPDIFRVTTLTAHANQRLLRSQIAEFQPKVAVLTDKAAARQFVAEGVPAGLDFHEGFPALLAAAADPAVDVVVNSLVGFTGLEPSLACVRAGKTLAIANKETLVAAGDLVMGLAAEKGAAILPVDSEHSAIAQCLAGERPEGVKRLLLTASGGPFRGRSRQEMQTVSLQDCLKHPNWTMGRKITIDSATMMNKGLEVIEAHWLFGVGFDRIEVVVHPQSIVHSMVEFSDGSVKAQLGMPDMRLPIQYALQGKDRMEPAFSRLDFTQPLNLTFEPPDLKSFPALPLAYAAGRQGGTYPCVMNAANEVAVQAFIDGRIGFGSIIETVETVLTHHNGISAPSLADYLGADKWARATADKIIDKAVEK